MFRILLLSISEGSLIDPFLFNIFINDFCLCLNKPELHDFSEAIAAVAKYIKEIMKTTEKDSHRLI